MPKRIVKDLARNSIDFHTDFELISSGFGKEYCGFQLISYGIGRTLIDFQRIWQRIQSISKRILNDLVGNAIDFSLISQGFGRTLTDFYRIGPRIQSISKRFERICQTFN